MPKTVAILTSEPPNMPGGVEHVVRELATGLEARGYEALVLHRENAAPPWLRHPKSRLARGLADFLLSWYLGRRLLSFADHDLAAVITNGPIGWYVPRINGNSVSKIHMYHGTYRGQADAIRPFITYKGYLKLKWWDSMVLEKACGAGKQILCNSDQTREEVERFFGHHAVTTWPPLDTSHFTPLGQASCRRILGLPEGNPVGLFVGSTQPTKGFPMVQTLIRSLPNIRWLLALRGSIPDDLAGNHQVHIVPNAGYDMLPTLYNAANFAVFPSAYESFGYALTEALACGTPVIAAPGGASRSFLHQPPLDSLLIEDAADVDAYIAATCKVLSDPPRYRESVVRNARPRIVETMALENWWPRFLEVARL
jgi:glycosyltransferase involved in cell wall biosynthesis